MNIYSQKYSDLMNRFPGEKEAIARLYTLLENEVPGRSEFGLNQLYDETHPKSQTAFSRLIEYLVTAGILKEVIRLQSKFGDGGLEDYLSWSDVPKVAHDWRHDKDFLVEKNDLRLIYILSDKVVKNSD